jgi:magnesium-transporting ATPase (P-type)
MDDQELFEVWKRKDSNEQKVFNQHKDELANLAKAQSQDIFNKIKRNILIEVTISIIVAVFFPILFYQDPIFFWVMIVIMAASLFLSLGVYLRYLKDLRELNESSIISSLEKKVSILKRYVKQLNILVWVFTPIGFYFGLAYSLEYDELIWSQVLIVLGVTLPFLVLSVWLATKYVHAMYGKHLKKVEKIYQDLIESE